jgi:hypothetical protein
MCGAGRGGAAIWGGGGAAMCGAGRGGAAIWGGRGAAMCGGAGLAGGAAGCGAGAACPGGPGFFSACEGALVVTASKTATKSDATNPLIRTISLLSAGFGKQREAGMKVSNPRGVTESKSRDHRKRGGQPTYPPPISNCQLRMRAKSGFFEYSAALLRAESAEAAGELRSRSNCRQPHPRL